MTTKAPKFAPITGEAALAMRQKAGTNQSVFYQRVGIGEGHVVGRVTLRPNRLPVLVNRGIAEADRDHAVRRELHRARSAVETAAVVGLDGRELGSAHDFTSRALSMASAI